MTSIDSRWWSAALIALLAAGCSGAPDGPVTLPGMPHQGAPAV